MLNDKLNVTGKLRVAVHGPDGSLKDEFTTDNLVVNAGLNFIAARMVDAAIPSQMSHMDIGSNSAAPAAGDTTLGTSLLGGTRVALTSSTPSSNTVEYEATFGAGIGTGGVEEAGIFNEGTTSGTMLCRTTFSVVNKGAADSMTITWTITIS